MHSYFKYVLVIFGIIGIFDAGFLTYEHYQQLIPPCSIHTLFADCGKVLNSSYSKVLGIPLALIGLIHYLVLTTAAVIAIIYKKREVRIFLSLVTTVGLISSIYFVYIQLVVLNAICLYCMISAVNSLLLFITAQICLKKEQKTIIVKIVSFIYRYVLKNIFFKIDPEVIHTLMTRNGESLGKFFITRKIISLIFNYQNKSLSQTIAGIKYINPVGLSAGFDYEARLTGILPSLGFGFETVGTITNGAYGGNPRPMLARLPKSRSLMVNKGFKNDGADEIIKRLEKNKFKFPVGISIGRTNRSTMTQSQSVTDITQAFKKCEQSSCNHTYYELNISCPNLFGTVNFYSSKNLNQLLTAIDKINISKPVFVKMPIEKNDKEVLQMLNIIAKHPTISGVIFGNLQKNRQDPSLDPEEVKQFPIGNFSGKPTYNRSNQLIKLAYKKYKNRFIIIGCGGIFSAEDAYTKITLGASIVQLITGMIYNGPQLITEINIGLTDLLEKDGFKNISQAIGSKNN